ncbi:MAG: hypothetical protein N4A33_04205 [Bacteriovoracaceae bacterium]|jgi:acetone carboxylase gamma subunit|nr:hypothetical protein [Bacteriovoracaceae bacterium]
MKQQDYIQKQLNDLAKIENDINNPHFDLSNHDSFKVHFKIDNSLKHATFKEDKENPGHWFTTSQTFKALRSNIFATDTFEDLEEIHNCNSCKTDIDKQFWLFCPYCGSSF